MKNSTTVVLLALIFVLHVDAVENARAVKPDENILANGALEADQTDFPIGWHVSSDSKKFVKWMPSGGPGALPYFRLESISSEPHGASIRQTGINLVSNGLYRLSAKVRTKGFQCKTAGVVVINSGWKKSRTIGAIPKDTDGKWKEMACTFEPFDDKGVHQVVFYAIGFTGTFDVADVKLTAENEAARAETEPSVLFSAMNTPRLVPFAPLLWEIPKSKREVEFRLFGKVPSGRLEDYDLELSVDEAACAARRSPLSEGSTIVALPDGAEHGVMTVRGVERASGREICSERFTFRTVDAPTISSSCGRRLNNLSTELLNVSLVGRSPCDRRDAQRFAFAAPRSGWLYIALRRAGDCPPYKAMSGMRVTLDGREVIAAATPRFETFREVSAGPHEIVVDGKGEGRLIVRAIAEIFSYPPCAQCPVREGPRYDWAYEERHVLPAITTENGGTIPTNAIASFHSRGYRWLANLNTTGLSAERLEKAISQSAGMMAPRYAGVTCDEQFFAQPQSLAAYTKGLKNYDLKHSPKRVIYTWIVGKPMTASLDHAFIATCINASRGRGKLLFEMYCRTPGITEDDAKAHLRRYVCDTLDRCREWYPLSIPSSCVAFGNFNQMPIISLAHHPEVDYKYYLDMQLNLAANDPSCRDLGAVGYWGCNYADDEMKRWSFALMRHYVVEGNTNMLSAAHGYRYCPGHLQDGDFCGGGVRGASALPAPWKATGEVRVDSHPEFARRSQSRWGGNGGVGDTFAVLVRGEGAPATIAQTAKGLVPGRTYCLQFATFDVKDVKANRIAPRRFGINVRLGADAEIREDLSWVHVDKRTKGRYDLNNGVARINLHHIVFTARAAETEVVFDNAAAVVGEKLGMNAVSLNPYFEGSAGLCRERDLAHGVKKS